MTVIELAVLALLLIACILTVQYSFLIPARKGLPVLMYHKIGDKRPDGLTVTADQLDLQLMYMKERGYQAMGFKTLKTLLKDKAPIPKKAIIITFDDAYSDFRQRALPLLKKYHFTATVFVPVAFMGKTNIWDKGDDAIMTPDDLKQLAINEDIEIGLHSFLHRSYRDLNIDDMEEDLNNCRQTLEFYGIPFVKVLAYPFGGYPKKDQELKGRMISLFQRFGLDFALRIGNRINPWPIRQPFEIKRIDMKGTDSFFTFRTKLTKGRARLFV
jgi:peptidoglycan/xylan/chitin deacetylase (PgdA/CDA1 family)